MFLDQDKRAQVRFHPAPEHTGVVFIRADQPGAPAVRCAFENLRSMPRWTALEQNGIWVHHTEHVLAALALCGVDNVRVEMNADRLPMTLGGNCAFFVAALKCAGVVAQDAVRRVYALKQPVFWLDRQNTQGEELQEPHLKGGRYVLGIPADRTSVSTVFHWSHMPLLPVGVGEYEQDDAGAESAIFEARSYLVESERQQVRILLGPVQDRLLTLSPGCAPELAHEAARHKIVDFLGDMMVLGRPLRGRFVAVRAGHRIHHDFIRHLLGQGLIEGRDG